ncbi:MULTISPECIES: class I SAM-dependent methyltransferase [unclassified Bradyrhizobium]|uniref:class I SAM-dependent methyltransferase n=1 Tax=Bradyrhizobium TaxID=374 RepID=UPI0029165E85|nr:MULTISPECIES: class I SAM-dependent methyltransferase [unclassified Bradyrhizobium]
MSPNYEFVFRRALSLAGVERPRVLDYGCGRGEVVVYGRKAGYEFFGADLDAPASERPEHFRALRNGRLDFDEGFFDVVISNQVFEHVRDPELAVSEIARVLKPGGAFLALFPDRTSWFEGHVGLYFVHHMPDLLAHLYMRAAHRLGFGYYREGKSSKEWADFMLRQLKTDVFYYSPGELRRWWRSAFGAAPASAEADFMRFRIQSAGRPGLSLLARLPAAAEILSFVCRKRAGIVWVTRKTDVPA